MAQFGSTYTLTERKDNKRSTAEYEDVWDADVL